MGRTAEGARAVAAEAVNAQGETFAVRGAAAMAWYGYKGTMANGDWKPAGSTDPEKLHLELIKASACGRNRGPGAR